MKKKQIIYRLASFVLVCSMFLSLFPLAALEMQDFEMQDGDSAMETVGEDTEETQPEQPLEENPDDAEQETDLPEELPPDEQETEMPGELPPDGQETDAPDEPETEVPGEQPLAEPDEAELLWLAQMDMLLDTEDDLTGSGTKVDPYRIYSADGLFEFADTMENISDSFIHAFLEQDIDLAGANWKPIEKFVGDFNGNGYTISGLRISGSPDTIGFFGTLGDADSSETIVSNLNIILHEDGISGDMSVGVLAGRAEQTQIIDCAVSGTGAISPTSDDSEVWAVGGLIGRSSQSLKIVNTTVEINILIETSDGVHAVGGIVGSISIDEEKSILSGAKFLGGIEIAAKEVENVGGAVGEIEAFDNHDYQLKGVTADFTQFEIAAADISQHIGGLIGFAEQAHGGIIDSHVSGDFIMDGALSYLGGLVGFSSAKDKATNTIDMSASAVLFKNSTANVNFNILYESGNLIGGIAGAVQGQVVVQDCRFYGEMWCEDSVSETGGLIGEIDAEFVQIENSFSNAELPFGTNTGGFIGRVEFKPMNESDIAPIFKELLVGFDTSENFIRRSGTSGEFDMARNAGDYQGSHDLGGFIGYASCQEFLIEDCYADWKFTAEKQSTETMELTSLGGFIGAGTEDTRIIGCYAKGSIILNLDCESVNLAHIGGFAGRLEENIVQDSYADMEIRITGTAQEQLNIEDISGFIAKVYDAMFENCFASGDIHLTLEFAGDDTDITHIGGLLGSATDITIDKCFYSGNINLELSGDGELCEYFSVAGLVAWVDGEADISDTYVTGNITIQLDGDVEIEKKEQIPSVALIIASLNCGDFDVTINNTYVAGSIVSEPTFAGETAIFAGWGENGALAFSQCYYDEDKAGDTPVFSSSHEQVTDQPQGLATLHMTRENAKQTVLGEPLSGMTGLDFDTIWQTASNEQGTGFYPQLQVFAGEQATSAMRALSKQSAAAGEAYYYVTHNGNGGKAGTEETVSDWYLYGTALQSPGFAKDGKPVLYWNTKQDQSGVVYPLVFPVRQDETVYAVYEGDLVSLTYQANGGTGTVPAGGNYPLNYEVTVASGSSLSRSGYDFTGWKSSADDKTYQENETFLLQQSTVLTAQWKLLDDGGNGGGNGGGSSSGNSPESNTSLDTENHFAYIIGYPNGEVRPNERITREETATIFFRLLTQDARKTAWSKQNAFSDVEAGRWSNNAVSTMGNAQIILGYPDGTFRPESNITRAEFAAIAVRFATADPSHAESAFRDTENHWAADEIALAVTLGYVNGYPDGTFRPENDITRAEVVTLLNRVLNRNAASEADMLPEMKQWTDNQDKSAWYYLDIQEATNSHYFVDTEDGSHETWTELRQAPAWHLLEKADSTPEMVSYE